MISHYHYTVYESVAAEFSLASFRNLYEAIKYNSQKNLIKTKEKKEELKI